MIYRSNLIAPDLTPHFKLLSKPRGHSFGHDCPSDPDFDPDCTYWTHDEAAILYHVAKLVGGDWVDIGCRFGWTSAHLAAAGASVIAVDPIIKQDAPRQRLHDNTAPWLTQMIFLGVPEMVPDLLVNYDGFVIDGCHDAPEPLNDAMGCVKLAKPNCVIMFHDFYGQPVQDAVTWLMKEQGFHCRIYWTPNGVACCWRGDGAVPVMFAPPHHVPDPAIIREGVRLRLGSFDVRATE
jgi:hypothetical protein